MFSLRDKGKHQLFSEKEHLYLWDFYTSRKSLIKTPLLKDIVSRTTTLSVLKVTKLTLHVKEGNENISP